MTITKNDKKDIVVVKCEWALKCFHFLLLFSVNTTSQTTEAEG